MQAGLAIRRLTFREAIGCPLPFLLVSIGTSKHRLLVPDGLCARSPTRARHAQAPTVTAADLQRWQRLQAAAEPRPQDAGRQGQGRGDHLRAARTARFLLVLCCPESARSEWVEKELRWFLEHRRPAAVLLALTDGDSESHPNEVFLLFERLSRLSYPLHALDGLSFTPTGRIRLASGIETATCPS